MLHIVPRRKTLGWCLGAQCLTQRASRRGSAHESELKEQQVYEANMLGGRPCMAALAGLAARRAWRAAASLMTVGGSCRWSPASTARGAFSSAPHVAASSACRIQAGQ